MSNKTKLQIIELKNQYHDREYIIEKFALSHEERTVIENRMKEIKTEIEGIKYNKE